MRRGVAREGKERSSSIAGGRRRWRVMVGHNMSAENRAEAIASHVLACQPVLAAAERAWRGAHGGARRRRDAEINIGRRKASSMACLIGDIGVRCCEQHRNSYEATT